MRKDGNNSNVDNRGRDSSHDSHPSQRLLPPRGDYRTLISFQKAEIIYDITFRYLIDHQLHRLEQDFLTTGGLRDRMTHARLQYRNSHTSS